MQYIAIFASGTGGHVYPAYAMAMRYIDKGYKILWIGTDNGLENRVIKDSNIIIKGIRSSGVRGKSRYQQIKSVFNLFISTIQAFLILLLAFLWYRLSMPSLYHFHQTQLGH